MAVEIERKFLVSGDFKPYVHKSIKITQGYLSVSEHSTVRVRLRDKFAFITVKGPGTGDGTTHFECEVQIPYEDARDMLHFCVGDLVEKTRHLIYHKGYCFEVDEFHGKNEGLLLAEVELSNHDEQFDRPEWLGEEVTSDKHYFNSYISRHPYSEWHDAK